MDPNFLGFVQGAGVEDGMKLIFDLAADARGKGPKAVNLKPIDGAADAGEEPSSGEEE